MSCSVEEIKIPKSADQEFAIEVRDEATNALLDLSPCSQILIVLFFEDGTILQKYARDTGTGWTKDINDDFAENGELRFYLDGSDTASAQEGKVYYELRCLFPTGFYSDGQDDKIVPKTYLFTLVESKTNGMTWPA